MFKIVTTCKTRFKNYFRKVLNLEFICHTLLIKLPLLLNN